MIKVSPKWQMIIAEIKKAYKKHAKDIKKSFLKTKAKIEAFINRLKKPYKYRYFTISECYAVMKKYKNIKSNYRALLGSLC